MRKLSLKSRLVWALVFIVTVTSTLYAGGVLILKQKLEEVIFQEMAEDQLDALLARMHDEDINHAYLFEGWEFFHGDENSSLPEDILALAPGAYHSIIINDRYYQLEVGEYEGEKVFLRYDITNWENLEHELLHLLSYGVLVVAIIAVLMGVGASRAILAPVMQLRTRLTRTQPQERNVRIAEDFPGTEVKQIAEAFDQYMERMDKFVEREQSFTAAASHELRTPLSVMIGALDILEVSEQSPAAQRAIQRIRKACMEMLAFIEATLFLSRESSQPASHDKPSSIVRIINDLVEDSQPELESQQTNLVIEKQQDFSVDAPESLLRITFSNILRNAIEHTANGNITVTCSDSKVTIKDSGEGIAEENIPHIFDRSYSTKPQGTGMGMNLVRRICDRFHWDITVTSSPGQGTEVMLDFGTSNNDT